MTREEEFNVFWRSFPRKIAKGNARKAFDKAIKKTTLETMLAAISRYVECKPDWQDYAHPASWLNSERWDDEWEPKQPRQNNRKRTLADAAIDYWGSHGHADGPWNSEQCGPTGFAPSLFDGNRRH